MLIVFGALAINNEFLIMVNLDIAIFAIMITSGILLLVTAGIGITAAYTKNHCLAFLVNI
jgi:hypothetical protein